MLLRKTYICGTWHLDGRITKEMKKKNKIPWRGQSNYCRKAKFWYTGGETREM